MVEFREDVQAPMTAIIVEYDGKGVVWIMGAAMRLLRDTLKVSTINLREDDIRWDVSNPEKKDFFGVWRGYRSEDAWSRLWLKITAQGNTDKEGYGHVRIKLEGWIITKYEYNNPLSQGLWRIWNYSFYWKQRRAYIDVAKDEILHIRESILKQFGLIEKYA